MILIVSITAAFGLWLALISFRVLTNSFWTYTGCFCGGYLLGKSFAYLVLLYV